MPKRSPPGTPLSARIWARIDTSGGPDACWPWTGACNADGYGVIKVDDRVLYTHRIVFAEANGGTIPAGHFVMHSCDNPPCNNPRHLSNGTCAENTKQAFAHGLVRRKKGKRWGSEPLELKLV